MYFLYGIDLLLLWIERLVGIVCYCVFLDYFVDVGFDWFGNVEGMLIMVDY